MKFISHGRHYETDKFGVIHQTDARPFTYDPKYVSTYDTEAYRRGSETLQALRLGFTIAAHGRPIRSLLDYGYGNGAFMKFAAQHIEYVCGFDLTGIKVEGCFIVDKLRPVEVVTFWDALEHVPDLSFLKNLAAETVVISLPYCHFHDQGQDWFDHNYKHRKPDEHLHHFNRQTLAKLMDAHGWRCVAISGHEDIVRKSEHGLQNILTMAFKRIGGIK